MIKKCLPTHVGGRAELANEPKTKERYFVHVQGKDVPAMAIADEDYDVNAITRARGKQEHEKAGILALIDEKAQKGPEDERPYRYAARKFLEESGLEKFRFRGAWSTHEIKKHIVGLVKNYFGHRCSLKDAHGIAEHIQWHRVTYYDGEEEKTMVKMNFSFVYLKNFIKDSAFSVGI